MIDLELRNITKIYQKSAKAVDNVSFSAKAGKFLVLLGPSGCGKTSLLRMIAGLESISSGELLFDNKLTNNVSPDKRNIGMVFQNYALYPHLTVFDNLAFPLQVQKINSKDIMNRVNQIAELIDLKEFLNRKPKQLSGGQRQRVALGRALIRKPDLFLFDEPLSNLDAKLRVQMRTEITNLHRKAGTTSVYVTHDQTEAMTMGDILVVINNGLVQQIDSPQNIYNFPANKFVAGFIGTPQMNLLEGKIVRQDGLTFIEDNSEFTLKINYPFDDSMINERFTIGIRPENVLMNVPVTDSNSQNIKKSKIVNIEYLGYEKIIFFETAHQSKSIRTLSDDNYYIGQEFTYCPDLDKLHIFDNKGNRIKDFHGIG